MGCYAKRQRTMTYMLIRVRNSRESIVEIEHIAISPSTSAINNDEENHIKRPMKNGKMHGMIYMIG